MKDKPGSPLVEAFDRKKEITSTIGILQLTQPFSKNLQGSPSLVWKVMTSTKKYITAINTDVLEKLTSFAFGEAFDRKREITSTNGILQLTQPFSKNLKGSPSANDGLEMGWDIVHLTKEAALVHSG